MHLMMSASRSITLDLIEHESTYTHLHGLYTVLHPHIHPILNHNTLPTLHFSNQITVGARKLGGTGAIGLCHHRSSDRQSELFLTGF